LLKLLRLEKEKKALIREGQGKGKGEAASSIQGERVLSRGHSDLLIARIHLRIKKKSPWGEGEQGRTREKVS